MSVFLHDAFAEALAGKWLRRPAAGAPIAGVSIDSRTLRAGEAFMAIRGDRFDGHAFVSTAAQAGAPAVIVDAGRGEAALRDTPDGIGVVEVDDTVRALARLAQAHRNELHDLCVIGVTGSNGKTTTCRILGAALGGVMTGVVSRGSYNNHLGLPLTLLRAAEEHDFAVCEMGTSSPGEIAWLSRLARPDVAIITSIGRAHVEGLGGLDGVRREKASIVEGMDEGALCLIPAGDPLLLDHLDNLDTGAEIRSFGLEHGADIRVTGVTDAAVERADGERVAGVRFTIEGVGAFSLPIPGAHNALNAAAAVGAALRLGLDANEIRTGLLRAAAPEMRMQRRRIGGVTIYNDAYNANPDSMRASLAAFAGLASDAQRRVCVLGDMLELGPDADAAHEEIGGVVASLGTIDLLVCVGPLAARIGAAARGATDVRTLAALDAGEVAALLRPGDAALLKASRAVGLERIEAALEQLETTGAGAAPPDTRCSSHSSI